MVFDHKGLMVALLLAGQPTECFQLADLPSSPQTAIMTPSDGLLLFTLAPPTQFNRLVH